MSGECFAASNMQVESSRKEPILENADVKHPLKEKAPDTNELMEYETIISTTQKKSNHLKQQIERLKELYKNQTALNSAQKIKGKYALASVGNQNNMSGKVGKKVRQNSYAIGTDTSGGALGTIGNILAGITKPIQIPDFHNELKKPNIQKNTSKLEITQFSQDQLHGVEEVKINTKSKQSVSVRSKTRLKKSKLKVTMVPSTSILTDIKKTVPKARIGYRKNVNQLPKAMTPITKKRSKNNFLKSRLTTNHNSARDTTRSRYTVPNPDLVELYHNTAVKESKSSDSDITKKKPQKYTRADTDIETIPPLSIGENTDKIMEPRVVISYTDKNYTLPTISSRMKQVAKCYMNSFSIKSIPFCLTTSTSPSHNIGINIQQVMSMVKSKQPVSRLSPTLAYNIGLAAERREECPLPFMVSSVASRNFYPPCPLSKSTINYQQLQEVAKTITEETIEETEENEDTNSPETQSMIITGPSGDVKITKHKQTVWTANSDEKKCTCITPKGVGFQQIINKFNGSVVKPRVLQLNCTLPVTSVKSKDRKTESSGAGEPITKILGESLPLQNKERKLKEVLKKLHDEFEKMTGTYDEVAKKCEEGNANPETLKELESLDKELNSKEEEIVMVMSLYKEVGALKQQVKTLKAQASKETMHLRGQQSKFTASNNNITTAGLLTKLLQRVQHYQTHYKKS